MATVVFAAVGQAAGSAIGGTVLGVSAAAIGQAVGAAAGAVVDRKLLGGSSSGGNVQGPRLDSLDVMTAEEGASLPRVDGRGRVGGRVIWATRLEEEPNTRRQGGGKGLGGGGSRVTEYLYYANVALAVAEGPIAHIGRVWADGKPLDTSTMEVRAYLGTETQDPDRLIEEKEGGDAPAYRGVAYVVFERMPLADFGNRVPQLSFEVYGANGDLEPLVRGVNIIPGSTEWGYAPEPVVAGGRDGQGNLTSEKPENATRFAQRSDWAASLDTLQATLPNTDTAALVVAWFGDDLRAGRCKLEPRIEKVGKQTEPYAWSVMGLGRDEVPLMSQVGAPPRPAFGSAPSDWSVVEAIKDMKARGLRVVFYPFIMMDIPADAGLPSPDGAGDQPPYPWRGRIRPEAGETVADEVAAFAGSAAVADFQAGPTADVPVEYIGDPEDAGFRRMILHFAHLCAAAGGVDAFLVGTEMVGMTTATDAAGVYPFVDVLRDLAADVSGILPGAQVRYAADWSEYHSHRIGGEVFFHLDPFWSDANVDFIGIDNYLPLADWRDGTEHLDYDHAAGITTQYSLDYLKSQVEGGEYWDYYYASAADRAAQVRTPIADSYGEPWVFRQKAIRDWHANAHHSRPGGVRDTSPTAWTASAKPIWFTELGCPAVDKGANEPNKFPSAISSEGSFPHFSAGTRDDFAQRQYLRAALEWWAENGAGSVAAADVLIWCWDARPWPEFPQHYDIWADVPDWTLGHWITGRAGSAPAAEAIRRRLDAHGLTTAEMDLSQAHGQVDGYTAPAPSGFRDWLQPLALALRLDAAETEGKLRVSARISAPVLAAVAPENMVEPETGPRFVEAMRALSEAPASAVLYHRDGLADYRRTAVRASVPDGPEGDQVADFAPAEAPLSLDSQTAGAAIERWLREASQADSRIAFALPPSAAEVAPGAILPIALPGAPARPYTIDRVVDGEALRIEATRYDRAASLPAGDAPRAGGSVVVPRPARRIILAFMDLPVLFDPAADPVPGFVAAHAEPWPGGATLWRSTDESTGYSVNLGIGLRAEMGETLSDLAPGRIGTWTGDSVDVRMFSGELIARPSGDVLSGASALALEHPGGAWEVIQYRTAEMISADTWRISGLIRGQRGTEWARSAAPLATGARVVALDIGVAAAAMTAADIGRPYWWKYGPTREGIDSDVVRTEAHTFNGRGLAPFAPAHLRAIPTGGDIGLTWIRRDRLETDAWGDLEPPMSEALELYRVEIGPEGAPARIASVTEATAWTYTAAMQAADGLSGAVAVRVYQLSETVGAGAPARATLYL